MEDGRKKGRKGEEAGSQRLWWSGCDQTDPTYKGASRGQGLGKFPRRMHKLPRATTALRRGCSSGFFSVETPTSIVDTSC